MALMTNEGWESCNVCRPNPDRKESLSDHVKRFRDCYYVIRPLDVDSGTVLTLPSHEITPSIILPHTTRLFHAAKPFGPLCCFHDFPVVTKTRVQRVDRDSDVKDYSGPSDVIACLCCLAPGPAVLHLGSFTFWNFVVLTLQSGSEPPFRSPVGYLGSWE